MEEPSPLVIHDIFITGDHQRSGEHDLGSSFVIKVSLDIGEVPRVFKTHSHQIRNKELVLIQNGEV